MKNKFNKSVRIRCVSETILVLGQIVLMYCFSWELRLRWSVEESYESDWMDENDEDKHELHLRLIEQ